MSAHVSVPKPVCSSSNFRQVLKVSLSVGGPTWQAPEPIHDLKTHAQPTIPVLSN